MPPRRTVLGGLGVGGAVVLYGGANVARLGRLDPTPIRADTWPLNRHDYRNTARSDVRVPADPAVAWEAGSVGDEPPSRLVVGPDRVYAAAVSTRARRRH